MVLPLVLSALLILILLVEWSLWMFFRRKIAGLVFPRDSDASSLRVFTVPRMKIFAILHAIILCTVVTIFFLLLW